MDRRFPIEKFDAGMFASFFGNQTEALQAELLKGGACNSNYLVETPNHEKFVCRIHNRGGGELEKTILELVNDLIPTPEYLWVGDRTSVMTYIEGEHFKPTSNLMREAGRIIGRLSHIKFNQSGQLLPNGEIIAFDGWSSYKEGLTAILDLELVRSYLNEQAIAQLRDLLEENHHLLAFFDSFRNLVHGDFRPDNILVSDNSIVGVLDWEFTHSGCSYMDIGNLMRHCSLEWKNDLETGLKEEGFELPEHWIFAASLIDLSSHLEFLTSNRSEEFKQSCVERIHRLIPPSS